MKRIKQHLNSIKCSLAIRVQMLWYLLPEGWRGCMRGAWGLCVCGECDECPWWREERLWTSSQLSVLTISYRVLLFNTVQFPSQTVQDALSSSSIELSMDKWWELFLASSESKDVKRVKFKLVLRHQEKFLVKFSVLDDLQKGCIDVQWRVVPLRFPLWGTSGSSCASWLASWSTSSWWV